MIWVMSCGTRDALYRCMKKAKQIGNLKWHKPRKKHLTQLLIADFVRLGFTKKSAMIHVKKMLDGK